jgi:hypothetical protein
MKLCEPCLNVMYTAAESSEGNLMRRYHITREAFIRRATGIPAIGMQIDGRCVGGAVICGFNFHLYVLPEYHGRWGFLFTPLMRWAFAHNDPLYALIQQDNSKVRRLIDRHDYPLIVERDGVMVYKLTNATTRYPE